MAQLPPSEPPIAEHQPYIPDSARIPEFTWSAVVMGSLLGIVFGASSLYLVLKVGLTVSASIPVAVLSITLFRVFSRVFGVRRATILENNIVQTAGSAGESIAFGVGVTMPALMLLGFEMDIGRVLVVSVLGGLLGILMMIPLRRAFIVKQHGTLKYPEGTACADVLIVGEQGGSSAKTVFAGFGIAFIYQFLMQGLKLWKEAPEKTLTWFKGATPALEVNPALLGVGYIIGTRISCVMVAGGVLASFVLMPAIHLFGDGLNKPLYPSTSIIHEMSDEDIWHDYVLYIGAGAVAAGGIISLFQSLPLILGSIRSGVRDFRATRQGAAEGAALRRTDHDLPLWLVGVGTLFLVVAIWSTSALHQYVWWVPKLEVNWLGALLIVAFGFFFVTVSSRLTGEIGSSSNPISGMTVATLLLTCLVFFLLGKIQDQDKLAALSVAAVVCIAASNGGTTSQDLKTGFLVGATPKWQQLAILAGTLSSAVVIGGILIVLNDASTVYTTQHLPEKLDVPLDPETLTDTQSGPDKVTYHVWYAASDNPQGAPEGKYLVDDAGQLRYLVDPGINGKINRRDDGTEVIKFKAPKAQLMRLIIDGILRTKQKLPWPLVLLGVSIALVLELCGVPSLPFAVGVYLPLSSSTPIFVGGLARWIVDRRHAGAARSETESEMSSGVLLSTGYIAGGAIAGVLIAFLAFSDTIPKKMAVWQYRHYTLSSAEPLDTLYDDLARRELHLPADDQANLEKVPADESEEAKEGADTALQQRHEQIDELAAEIKSLNADELPRYVPAPKGTRLVLPGHPTVKVDKETDLENFAREHDIRTDADRLLLLQLNQGKVKLPAETSPPKNHSSPEYLGLVVVPAGTELFLPKPLAVTTTADSTLGEIAAEKLGSASQAASLLDLNKVQLKLPADLPAGATLNLPQHNGVALTAFGILALGLLVVGMRKSSILDAPPQPDTSKSPWRKSSPDAD